MLIKRAITLSPIALQHLNFSFPDCQAGPLANNTVCDTSADYWTRATSLVAEFSQEELVNNTINYASGVSRLGLPAYQWWSEALHGVSDSPGVTFQPDGKQFDSATNFPHIINLGATFDDGLYEQVANHIANETRAYNNAGHSGLNLYSPLNINLFRDPRWGRGQETTGEDPLHMSRYAVRMVQGLQGYDPYHLKVAATCKHYIAYDLEKYNGVERYQFNAVVSTQDLADFYLPQFRACVRDAGAATLMTSYNAINGVPPSASKYYLQDIARNAWGFDKHHNYVTSDCDAIANVYDGHHYSDSYVTASADSINAGTDLDCGATYSDNLGAAIAQNLTSVQTLRTAVSRMYASLVRLGYFDSPDSQPLRQLTWEDVNTKPAQDLAYESAAASAVLLKNDGTLPLDKSSVNSVAVIGPYSTATMALRGNYAGPGPFTISVLEAARQTFGTVNWANGTAINTTNTDGFSAALDAARKSDVVLFAGGIDNTIESEEKDRADIAWPGNQLDLIAQLAQLGKKVIVLQFGGGQLDDSALKYNDNVNGLIWAGYPGQSGTLAMVDIVVGNRNPSGRLPITQYPASYTDGLAESEMALRPNGSYPGRTYKWYNGDAVYTYGHGLHYTTFSASLSICGPKNAGSGEFDLSDSAVNQLNGAHAEQKVVQTATVNVQNTGKRTSDYVALVFATHQNGPSPHPKRSLVAYKKLKNIAAGETRTAELEITLSALARANKSGDSIVYPGQYTLLLDSWENPLAQSQFTLTGQPTTVIEWVHGNVDARP